MSRSSFLNPSAHSTDDPIVMSDSSETLRARIRELETLCAEVYVAAVELGLPQPLLNKLWTVAARGSSPHAFIVDMPRRPPAPEEAPTGATPPAPAPAPATMPMPIPDIRLTDRPDSPGRDERPRAPQPELKPLPGRKTVMVVDDDPMMLEVLVRILRRENYELVTAADGPDALLRLEERGGTVDLLVTDFAMPQMKGRELAERIRQRCPEVKILYQTGFSDMLFEDRLELDEHEAFLEKPFTARGLREAARLALYGQLNP
ncbi:MAG: response regulator [Acidobacteriota bacterium]